MLNNVQCTAAAIERDAYKDVDGVVLLLCKECAEELEALQLPPEIIRAVRVCLSKYDDFHTTGKITCLTVFRDEAMLNIIIAGCGSARNCRPDNFRRAAGEAVRTVNKMKVRQPAVAAPILLDPAKSHYLSAVAEGFYLGAYIFDEFKSKPEEKRQISLRLLSVISEAQDVVDEAETVAGAVSLARDLANRPGNVVTPRVMAEEALKIAGEYGLEAEVLDEDSLLNNNMRAILAVGQGSVNKPKMIVLKYNGAGDAPFTAYVGKGITFDSGGISIKPSENMGEMKDDMSGAAAVLAAIKGAAALKKKCNIMAVMACAENMPGGNAQRPGDIVRAANGKTIEVVNTDAEGRMVLADAVWYACRKGARKVIDIATLTGAVSIALGKETAAVIANDDDLAAQLHKVGKRTGENFWRLPATSELKEALKSDAADLLNSAGRAGGCITGGLFIGEFVDEGIPWAHIDIGGTSTSEKTQGFIVKGSTGSCVMTLIKLAEEL